MTVIPKNMHVPGYQVIQYLGSGAHSNIWQVRDVKTYRMCVLKRVSIETARDSRFLQQALNEYHVATHLNHPGIRRVLSLKRIRRWFLLREVWMFMEFCEGKTVYENRPESIAEIVRIFLEVAKALAYMNNAGFVHADTKPNNIIVAPDGAVKIIDLGQSCTVGMVKDRIQGTPDFIAPEQVDRRPLDGRTDVFNFGASLYWTLTGKPIPTVLPKGNDLTIPAIRNITLPEQLNPAVPGALSSLVMDCIEHHPYKRPASMSEVASRLTAQRQSMHAAENGHA